MSDEATAPVADESEGVAQAAADGEQGQDVTDDGWTPPSREEWERLSGAARRREALLRKAQARIAELEGRASGSEGDRGGEDDPVARANARLVRAEARAALAAIGVPRDRMGDVLDVLNLSAISVDDSGEVDSDAVADLVDRLKSVFGGLSEARRALPRVDPRERARSVAPADPDSARYRRILTRGR